MSSVLEIGEGDLGKVYDELLGAASKWYNLGLQLGLSDDRLDCIKEDNRRVADCLREMLKAWLRTSQPTWKSLINALESKSVGRRQLAKRIREKYCQVAEPAQVQQSLIRAITSTSYTLLTQVIKLAIPMLLLALVIWYYTPSYIVTPLRYYQNLQHSKSLPLQPESFVGREEEVKNVSSLMDFMNSDTRIVSIIGGPGFGKSALAISVGHQMLSRGVTVYYVDMTEVTSMQALAEKIIEGDESIVSSPNITVERMYKWARQRYYNTLLILDNCDDMLNANILKEKLQKAVRKLLGSSEYLKILTTSRESTMHMSTFRLEWFRLQELQAKASCNLLRFYSEHITDTECEKITNLTGSVPLALKVVGSLLNQPDPPDPASIILDLEKQPLKTLSPEELPVDERVNACISMSYHYLSPSVQQVGQFLANFPGSFSLDAAVGVFEQMHSNTNSDDVTNAVNKLVQRSLLQRNHPAHTSKTEYRFKLHKLIKDFFQDVQVSADNYTHFSLGFHSYFSKWLFQLTINFHSVVVLKMIDQERHNILHFLLLFPIQATSLQKNFYAANVVKRLLSSNHLQYRFTIHELYNPTQSIVLYLQRNCKLQSTTRNDTDTNDCLVTYVSVLLYLASFEHQLNGISQAAALLEMHQYRVEEINPVDNNHDRVVMYIHFYRLLSNYYQALGEYEKDKECHINILQANEILGSCSSQNTCDYHNVGLVYYSLDYYESAIHFLELALIKENLDMIVRGRVLTTLHNAYDKVCNQQEKEAVMGEILDLFSAIMNVSDEDILDFVYKISFIIDFFRSQGKIYEASTLEQKQVQAIKEAKYYWLDNESDRAELFWKAKRLASFSYERGWYFTVVEMAQFSLELLTPTQASFPPDLLERQEVGSGCIAVEVGFSSFSDLMLLIAKAKLFDGNLTEALESFDKAVDHIYEFNQTEQYAGYLLLCPILILRGSFNCALDHLHWFTGRMLQMVITLFTIPLNLPKFSCLDFLVEDSVVSDESAKQSTNLVFPPSSLQLSHSNELSYSQYAWSYDISALISYLKTLWSYIIMFWTVRTLLKVILRVPILFLYIAVLLIWLQAVVLLPLLVVCVILHYCMLSFKKYDPVIFSVLFDNFDEMIVHTAQQHPPFKQPFFTPHVGMQLYYRMSQ